MPEGVFLNSQEGALRFQNRRAARLQESFASDEEGVGLVEHSETGICKSSEPMLMPDPSSVPSRIDQLPHQRGFSRSHNKAP